MRNVLSRRLFTLAAVGIVPLAVMAGVGLITLVQREREQTERAGLDLTRALSTAVEAELRRTTSLLEAMATSPALDDGKIDVFEQAVQRVMSTKPPWRAVILLDPSGRIVSNSEIPGAAGRQVMAERASFERVLQTHSPMVGSLARGPKGELGVAVRVPVLRDNTLRYVLTGVVKPEAVLEVITRQRVPEDWVVSVFDANRARVARSRGHEGSIGTAPAPGLQEMLAGKADEGIGVTDALEGDRVLTAFTRRPDTGWTVAIGTPMEQVEVGAWRSAVALGGGVLLSLLMGGLASLSIARRINRPIKALREAAQALGRGELPAAPASDIPELQEVGDALLASARQRDRDETEREHLLQAERAARGAAEEARLRLELLASAGSELSRSLEPQATLAAIAAVVVPGVADWCRVDLLDADGKLQRALTHHSDPEKSERGRQLAQRLHAAPDTPGSMAWSVATGRSHLAQFEPPDEFDAIRDQDLLTFARAIGMRAYFIVPLVARGRTLGAMAALQAESRRSFTDDDCSFLSELAQRAALALSNAQLYAEAESARRQAEKANRAKDEFLAMLGHELRNPLAPIVTALQLMARREDAGTLVERRIIERQVAHLMRLVDDLLDVSRIAEGKIQLELERVDMKAVVARALELTQPLLGRRRQSIAVEIADRPLFVPGDAVRLAQVLGNLLTNAVKYTPPDGSIWLRLRPCGDQVEVVVEDTGSGIEPALLPRVFDLFSQGEQPIDRRAGGLGLGLAIVKTLVQLHGGSVTAHSDGPGRGSRFVVRLPGAEAPALAPTDAPPADIVPRRHGRILVVDDNRDALEMLGALLRDAGHEVRDAPDGAAALKVLDGFVPDLALLDIGLPGMDGYELAGRLRADPRCAGTRLVALTGYGRQPDRERAFAANFDEHLVKPIGADVLLDVIERLLQRAVAGPRPVSWRRTPGSTGRDPASHRLRLVACRRFVLQSSHHAFAVRGGAVLADLPLALQRDQLDLDADDRAHHAVDEIGRCVLDLPGLRAPALVALGELADQAPQPRRIVDRAQAAARLHGDVVPGRHDLAGLGLRRVPGRAHVGLRTLEDDQAVDVGARVAPDRIGARDVSAQGSLGAAVRIEQEGNRVRSQAIAAESDEQAERTIVQQRMQHFGTALFEMRRQVHVVQAASAMTPPPRHTSPSYSTADWPGVTAHCDSPKRRPNLLPPGSISQAASLCR
jgi:signal transduction histidine kinase/DNA-binding response OmpR family regulator